MPSLIREPPRSELQRFTAKVLIFAAAVVVFGLLWLVRDILVLVFIAAVLAAGIAPAVRHVQARSRLHFHRRLPRGPAVLIVYLPFVIVAGLLAFVLLPRLIQDSQEMSAQIPALIETNVVKPLERYFPMDVVRHELREGVTLPRSTVFKYVRNVAMVIASVIAVLFMIFYMLIDAERLRNSFLLIYPSDERADKRQMLNRIANRMSLWLSGQLILAGIIGVATFIAFSLLRIPYALPLAILAAFGELIPVIGPIVGAIPALAMAMLSSPWQFWSVLVFAIVLQKAENLFIAPRVLSRKISISPLAIFIAFMMGASLLGIVGAIMAIPIAAILQVTFEEAFVAHRERRQDVDRAGTLLRRVD
jgi:predicted PurR-regulated permease PerM